MAPDTFEDTLQTLKLYYLHQNEYEKKEIEEDSGKFFKNEEITEKKKGWAAWCGYQQNLSVSVFKSLIVNDDF